MIQNISLFAIESMVFGSLTLFGIYFSILYAYQRFQKETLYFSILCGLFAVRVLVTGNQSIGFFFSDFPKDWMLRLECISSVGILVSYLFMGSSLYPNLFTKRWGMFLNIAFWIYALFILLFNPSYYISLRPYLGLVLVSFLSIVLCKSVFLVQKKSEDSMKFIISCILLLGFYGIAYFLDEDLTILGIESYHIVLVFSPLLAYTISCRIQRVHERTEILSEEIQNSNQLAISMNKNYEKFVPSKFFSYLGKDSVLDVSLGDNSEKVLTIQFTQILEFWNIVRGIPSENIYRFLNSYLARVSPSILNKDGIIDKFIDNTILAIFPDDPSHAIESAIEMQWEIEVYNIHRRKFGYRPIQCGIGIHRGPTRIGIIGEENRREITVISDTVNLASRIQGLTGKYGARILVSLPTIYDCLRLDIVNYRMLDMVRVKGKKDHVAIGEVLIPGIDEVTDRKIEQKHIFEEGIFSYVKGDFFKAKDLFTQVNLRNPNDIAARMYLERADYLLRTGSGSEFEGIHQWDAK